MMAAPATDALLSAGRTLAALAEPDRDLFDIGRDISEIAETLRLIGTGLKNAEEEAEEQFEARIAALAAHNCWNLAERREWTRDEIELSRVNELKRARATAARTVGMALVDLARVASELEG